MKYIFNPKALDNSPKTNPQEAFASEDTPETRSDSNARIAISCCALEDIWGKWPGDETIEELLAALTP